MEFPQNVNTYQIDEQLLWGSALLISPALTEDNLVTAYFPPESNWYDYYTGAKVTNEYETFDTPLNGINLHVRSGHVIQMQQPDVVTAKSRNNPFGLLYSIPKDDEWRHRGDFFWDDGESIEIELGNSILAEFKGDRKSLEFHHSIPADSDFVDHIPRLDNLTIYGLDEMIEVISVEVDQEEIDLEFEIFENNVLKIVHMNLDLKNNLKFKWSTKP